MLSQCLLIFVVKPGDLRKHIWKLNKVISDHQFLLWSWKLYYVLRCFSGSELECFLSPAGSEMPVCDHKEAELEEQVPGRGRVVLGPRRCPWAGLLPWPALSQESHLGSCSGNSIACWYCGTAVPWVPPLRNLKLYSSWKPQLGHLCTTV